MDLRRGNAIRHGIPDGIFLSLYLSVNLFCVASGICRATRVIFLRRVFIPSATGNPPFLAHATPDRIAEMSERRRMTEMLRIGAIIGASFIMMFWMLADSEHPKARIWGTAAAILMQISGWITAIRRLRKSTP
jgi:hypothetical protein